MRAYRLELMPPYNEKDGGMIMKKGLAFILVVLLTVSAGAAFAQTKLENILETGVLTIATSPDFAPLEFIDPNKTGQESYVGLDMAVARYIAEKLGVELQIEAMDFSAVLGAVTTSKVDLGISGFAYTEERAEVVILSDFYNYDEEDLQQGIMVRTEDYDNYLTAEDFAGKKVAVQNASLQYNLLTEYTEAVPELVTNLQDGVMMLISGKVDALAMAKDTGESFSTNYPDITMSQFYYNYSDEGNVIAIPLGEDDLAAAVNEILAEINELGLCTQWKADAVALSESLGVN